MKLSRIFFTKYFDIIIFQYKILNVQFNNKKIKCLEISMYSCRRIIIALENETSTQNQILLPKQFDLTFTNWQIEWHIEFRHKANLAKSLVYQHAATHPG